MTNCHRCDKPVYFAEEARAIGKSFHKECLKCEQCNKVLDSTSLQDRDDSLFCRSCYGKLYGPRGYGFAGGSSGLSTTNGVSNTNNQWKSDQVTVQPQYGTSDRCPRCKQVVYFAEEMRAQGKKYHKRCMVCCSCKKSLDSTNLNTHDDDIYCKSCYSKKYGPRGYGFAGGSSGLSMENGNIGDNVSSLAKAQAVSMATNGNEPKQAGPDDCPKCGKRVYFAEEKRAQGRKFHKLCLTCTTCRKQLDSTNLTNHNEDIYCKSCYGKKFGPRGYGFAGGSSGLSMDTGKIGQVSRDNVSSYSQAQVVGEKGPKRYGGTDSCPRCGKAVYFAEKVMGGGRSWHKLCFRCEDCGKALESTTLCEAGDKIVCKSCYGKHYGPKGFGFGALNTTE